ncbi:ATP-binding protein [Streptomyces thermolilacinus]|uniref:Regulator n=1 Tax=Streptomyces thermolilacinus SPC6 TaxID=1306406 RepID=A0A1D3DXL7_9ACTN|nr:tetratricopeptide repeat protein [Streptomyces thermolilacinus]OEJ97070.1 regulator [Streptomyces thermolilacinus SPC6]
MRRSNLPAELNRFVGRDAECAELDGLLAEFRLVTVVGVGGVGKSRLVLRAARATQKRYCHGVRLAELAGLREPDLVEHALVEALGLADQTSRPPREVLVDHLADRRLLLVIDGFEHLVDACAELVRLLLCGAPGLTVLAAGRRPLRLDGEAVLPLPPMSDEDAVRLFTERAVAAWPGFRAEEEAAPVRELCRRLDGIPLALELAAGRLPALTVQQVLDRLDDRFRLLTGGMRGAPARHQTLRTAIGWSHELCTPRERLLWARLSVFAGPFDLDAAEYVCGGPDLPADRVLDVLGELIAQSVVLREADGAGPRYRMLDTVAAYGAEWLEALGDAERVRRRHRDWYMGLATWCELEWFSSRQAEVAECTAAALPNLRAALELCLKVPGEAHLAQHMAGTLWFCWVGCGRLAEGRHWLDRALALPSGHEEARLKALWVLAYVAILQGDATAAMRALHECGERATLGGNALALAYTTHRLGCLALLSDDMPRAQELLGRALGSYRELGELNSQVLMAQVELAITKVFQGDLEAAVALCEDAREVCEERGERWTRAYALYVLAYAAWTRGDHGEARELLDECVTINHAFHDLVGLVLAIELLALVTASEGDPAEAAVLQGAAGALWEAVGPPLFGSAYFGAPRALCERRAREALGAERFGAYVAEGGRLPLDAAVARALAGLEGRAGRAEPGSEAPEASDAPADRTRDGAAPVPDTRKPAGSPTGKAGEAAG